MFIIASTLITQSLDCWNQRPTTQHQSSKESSQWFILTPQSFLGELTQWVILSVSTFRWSTLGDSSSFSPLYNRLLKIIVLQINTLQTLFIFLSQNLLLLNALLVDLGLEIIFFFKSFREFSRFQARKHALFFWYGIVHQQIVLN